ncbi:MAG: hypothetical protein ACI4QE_03220 [Acutalibacteraceae bacterium]
MEKGSSGENCLLRGEFTIWKRGENEKIFTAIVPCCDYILSLFCDSFMKTRGNISEKIWEFMHKFLKMYVCSIFICRLIKKK